MLRKYLRSVQGASVLSYTMWLAIAILVFMVGIAALSTTAA